MSSKSVNKVILVGNVGNDPEIKYTPSGTPVAKFSLATNEKFKDKAGEWQDKTEWHNLIAWQRLAEITGEYVKKGNKLYVEGRLETSSWEDKNSGEKKYRTEIVAKEIVLLGGGDSNGSSSRNTTSQSSSKSSGKSNQGPHRADDFNQSSEITDDDIPF